MVSKLGLDDDEKEKRYSSRRGKRRASLSRSEPHSHTIGGSRFIEDHVAGSVPPYHPPVLGSPFMPSGVSRVSKPNHDNLRFEPHRFEMYVTSDKVIPSQVHCFTKLRSPTAQLDSMTIPRTQDIWPQIASIWNDGSPECEIVLAESTLELTAQVPSGAELGIEFSLTTHCNLNAYEKFQCKTRFFNDETPFDETVKHIDYDSKLRLVRGIPFGSHVWARNFMQLAMKIKAVGRHVQRAYDATIKGDDASPAEEAAKYVEQEIRSTLSRLSVVQEIYATRRNSAERQRLFAIFWKFEQADAHEQGTTTWRRLILDQATSSHQSVGSFEEEGHISSLQSNIPQDVNGIGLTQGFTSLGFDLHTTHHADNMLAVPHSQFQLPLPEFSILSPPPSMMSCNSRSQPSLLAPSSSIYHHSVSTTAASSNVDFSDNHLHVPLGLNPGQSALFPEELHLSGAVSNAHISSVFDHHHPQPWATNAFQIPCFGCATPIYHLQQPQSFEDSTTQGDMQSALHGMHRAASVHQDEYTHGGAIVSNPINPESFSETHVGVEERDSKPAILDGIP